MTKTVQRKRRDNDNCEYDTARMGQGQRRHRD